MPFCGQCGTLSSNGTRFCGNCGNTVSVPTVQQTQSTNSRHSADSIVINNIINGGHVIPPVELSLWRYYQRAFGGGSPRARRKEFWGFILWNSIIIFVLNILVNVTAHLLHGSLIREMRALDPALSASISGDLILGMSGFMINVTNPAFWLLMLYCLIAFFAFCSVGIRRLHDTGRSGWNMLLLPVPVIGQLYLFALFCMEGTAKSNRYGPNPKEPTVI